MFIGFLFYSLLINHSVLDLIFGFQCLRSRVVRSSYCLGQPHLVLKKDTHTHTYTDTNKIYCLLNQICEWGISGLVQVLKSFTDRLISNLNS